MDIDEIPIGRFGRLCGLSVHTLRHYDDVGLLVPARVDESTGYRWYRADQLERARQIRSLRWTDLSIDDTRTVLDDPAGAAAVFEAHRARLERERSRIAASIGDTERFASDGLPTSGPPAGARPVQIKLLVSDQDAAAAFYIDAFGFDDDVTQRTADEDFSGFMFGRYGESDFFLVHLQTADYPGAAGPATIGLLVDDLDAAHRRALDAGAAEVLGPHESQGMPRSSAVRDPDANVVWLYQG
ncbi:MerR family transcriptional regulator [Cellulomonas rhizosphaerae]|uniref:MerR family transcriptional regulator n=1 Tax=Cellulomonas rhizosphaerae TaxID=2293719 RepID=A0A413RJW5_9CELL|nr:MerR family transcriptional regulator [Cellulomonas rhizosphaerae]RHA38982.1 MerR family transcriptional regulator [Cellulomonas rhizosphaerae]